MAINHSIHGFFELGINQLDHPNRMNHLTGSSGTFKECWFDPPNSGEGNTWKKYVFMFFWKKRSFKKYVENPMKTIDSQSSNPIPKAKHHFLYQKITQLQKPRHLFPIWAKLLHFLLRRLRHRRSATELGGQRLAIHPRRRLGGRGCGIGFDHSLIFFGGW